MSLAGEFLAKNGGDATAAAVDLARGLMEGDADSLKAGYTAENALLAVEEVFNLSREQFQAVGASIGASNDFVNRHAKTIWERTHSAHIAHPDIEGAILFDDCPGCERHVAANGCNLDHGNFVRMWNRMLDVNFGNEHYRSTNEAKLGNFLYTFYVLMERHMAVDPRSAALWK